MSTQTSTSQHLADLLCKKTENHPMPPNENSQNSKANNPFIHDLRQCQRQRQVGTITTAEARADIRLLRSCRRPIGPTMKDTENSPPVHQEEERNRHLKIHMAGTLLNRPSWVDGAVSHPLDSNTLAVTFENSLRRHSELNKVAGEVSAPVVWTNFP